MVVCARSSYYHSRAYSITKQLLKHLSEYLLMPSRFLFEGFDILNLREGFIAEEPEGLAYGLLE